MTALPDSMYGTYNTETKELSQNPLTNEEPKYAERSDAAIIGINDLKSNYELKHGKIEDLKTKSEPRPGLVGGPDRRLHPVKEVDQRADELKVQAEDKEEEEKKKTQMAKMKSNQSGQEKTTESSRNLQELNEILEKQQVAEKEGKKQGEEAKKSEIEDPTPEFPVEKKTAKRKSDIVVEVDETATQPPVKRGRGRPPKPKSASEKAAIANAEAKPKRGRGRPPKAKP